MINSKVTRGVPKEDVQERLFKLLESIDWKLWEIYNMMKDAVPEKQGKTPAKKTTAKSKKDTDE
jgi:hypothetical protein